ncbi:hypothetical protein Tco_0732255 [Tanacetum coccineum]
MVKHEPHLIADLEEDFLGVFAMNTQTLMGWIWWPRRGANPKRFVKEIESRRRWWNEARWWKMSVWASGSLTLGVLEVKMIMCLDHLIMRQVSLHKNTLPVIGGVTESKAMWGEEFGGVLKTSLGIGRGGWFKVSKKYFIGKDRVVVVDNHDHPFGDEIGKIEGLMGYEGVENVNKTSDKKGANSLVDIEKTINVDLREDFMSVGSFIKGGFDDTTFVDETFLKVLVGVLPRLKLPLHSCSLAGSTCTMEVSIPIAFVLPGREHECNESFKLGRPPALS